ncbi:hypothetical protein GCM10022399_03660 [Terrabacter ginsenosidimutans]|uniref:Uncharacterized protein n=1 Tax=Terrabacter ginsenosidimutans TaxID=490575 RepID=A0ABP7CI34_9MICO
MQPGAQPAPRQVGHLTAAGSGQPDGDEGEPHGDLQCARRHEHAGTDEQRVGRQEDADQKPGLGESHCHEHEQGERTERRQQTKQKAIHSDTPRQCGLERRGPLALLGPRPGF